MNKFPGGHRGRVTPVPIPNTEVKPATADGTACVGAWESRSLPGIKCTHDAQNASWARDAKRVVDRFPIWPVRFHPHGPFSLYARGVSGSDFPHRRHNS